jgi:twitching motility protein PilU
MIRRARASGPACQEHSVDATEKPNSIEPYLRAMIKHSASDLFLSTGTTARLKIDGKTRSLGERDLKPGEIRDMAYALMSEAQIREFETTLEFNMALSMSDIGRFRMNVYRQRGEVSVVLRYIKSQVPEIGALRLPKVLESVVLEARGLVLVVGGTGSGKSTTLAAMIEHRNQNVAGHIITIEDPIEYIYRHKRSVVDQREVGLDTLSFDNALSSALREAPDVILIGEIRDTSTMLHALNYANTGHLCLATLHANNAWQAVERMTGFFPAERHKQLLEDMSLNLRAVICQRLLRTADGNRVPAVEVLLNRPHIAEIIKRGSISDLRDALSSDESEGMVSMDSALLHLYEAGLISVDEALAHADSRVNLEVRLRLGGTFSSY